MIDSSRSSDRGKISTMRHPNRFPEDRSEGLFSIGMGCALVVASILGFLLVVAVSIAFPIAVVVWTLQALGVL